MKTKVVLKLFVTGAAIVGIAFLLKGHDTLTAIFFSVLFLSVMAKLAGTFFAQWKHRSRGQGGTLPPLAPALVPAPRSPRPPAVFHHAND